MFNRILLRAVIVAASAASVPALAQSDAAPVAGMRAGSATASAEVSYPRIIGFGENSEIDYGPGLRNNIVGGGTVVITGSGENTEIRHLDPSFAQAPRPGLVPVTVGSSENSSIVWVPAGPDRARLALTGEDGSLLAESRPGRAPLARLFGNAASGG